MEYKPSSRTRELNCRCSLSLCVCVFVCVCVCLCVCVCVCVCVRYVLPQVAPLEGINSSHFFFWIPYCVSMLTVGPFRTPRKAITMKGIDIIFPMYRGISSIGRCVHMKPVSFTVQKVKMKMNIRSAEGWEGPLDFKTILWLLVHYYIYTSILLVAIVQTHFLRMTPQAYSHIMDILANSDCIHQLLLIASLVQGCLYVCN